ncbi:transposase [Polaribacter batillariae]|uniref:Transposase n=1 Tax=Polaribacter batillariae TaxID=2808900 RepID=A0ABX7SZV4_9FLAO|nr:transposase [Polaribacter batillariae]QTD38820.1 transposase [Polaribacter batillariae]
MQIEKINSGFYYHIYNRGNNSQDIFFEELNYDYFLNLIKKYLLPISKIYCYCLLKNHFHILLRINDDCEKPSKYFSNLFNAYTKAINKKYKRTGSLLEKPFKRINITDENYLKTLIIYIHLNPENHQISNNFSRYKFSSYQSFLSSKETSLDRNEVLDLFDGLENFISTHEQRKVFINNKNKQLFLE